MDRSREYALLLLRKARDAQRMLNVLLDAPDTPAWGLGFHGQQAVEKALKAVLCSRGVTYP
jgi:HEPN domain-containing protein